MHAMNGTMRLASSGTRQNHRNKRNFSRIGFDQDDRFLCPTSGPIQEIAGLVERVTFFYPESGFAVFRAPLKRFAETCS
jgi:hypothetical protein